MNKPLLSIIVAIYNVEQYLPKCIRSILSQSYHDIELILVVDGSPDNSLKICNDFASKDSRIIVVEKENGGQATARNRALDIAKGDYIGFVDGDDWVEPDMYDILLNTMIDESADIVQCGWYKVDESNAKICPHPEIFKEVYTSDQGLEALLSSKVFHLNTSVCCKLFKKEITTKIRFTPVRAYEDDEYIFRAVSIAEKVVCISTPLYNYFNRENSTMTSHFNLNKISLITIQNNICNLIKERLPYKYYECERVLCSKQFYILHQLLTHPEVDADGYHTKQLINSINKSFNRYLSNPIMGKNKIMLYAIRYLPTPIWKKLLLCAFKSH